MKFWKKVTNSLKKGFDSQQAYNEKHLKAEIKSYNGKINANLHGNKIPKESCQFISLSVILIGSVFKNKQKL